MNEIRGKELC